MARINVYSFEEDTTRLIGWFDDSKAAETVLENKQWNGSNRSGVITGLQIGYEEMIRTASGRWVLHHNSRAEFQGPETYDFVSDQKAREWLLLNGSDEIVQKYFGDIEEERGPGRPSVEGSPITYKPGAQLLADVDSYASSQGISRAEAFRRLTRAGLEAVKASV